MGFNMTLSTVVVFLPIVRHLAVVPGNIARNATIFFVYSVFYAYSRRRFTVPSTLFW
ncbi:MAG: hypothetical protein ACJATD_000021 [Alloalcanivorax sp.]|jgi:hypothetical protein